MSRDTLNHTIDELYGLLSDKPDGVVAVYDYEPGPGQMAKPTSITVSGAGQTNDVFSVWVRVYVASDVDARTAERTRNDIMGAVDTMMAIRWGPTDWECHRADDLDAFMAECRVEVGREDGWLRFAPTG